MRSFERIRRRLKGCAQTQAQVVHCHRKIYDIFEGTEQIQQLVIARAISGRHIA